MSANLPAARPDLQRNTRGCYQRTCFVIGQACAACGGEMASDGFARWCMNTACPSPPLAAPEGGYTE